MIFKKFQNKRNEIETPHLTHLRRFYNTKDKL